MTMEVGEGSFWREAGFMFERAETNSRQLYCHMLASNFAFMIGRVENKHVVKYEHTPQKKWRIKTTRTRSSDSGPL